MASEEPATTETEEDMSRVLKKKRANRRVSFADVEITSVHIFNRDDDFSEDQLATPNTSHSGPRREALGFFRDLADSDDSPPHPDLDDQPNSFLRPVGSPSPGSSTVGSASAASNDDEDDFFGPVSANFIRPGRLSDSAASDDITMDSTAFSMHFRSLARSDSGGGDLKTPTTTAAHRLLAFEDNSTTPSHNAIPTDSVGFMVLTKAKKSTLPVDRVSSSGGGKDSNDMSIVGEHQRSYDYGRLSPRLDALLAESNNILNSISIDSKLLVGSEDMHDMSAEPVSLPRTKMGEAHSGSTAIPVDQNTHHQNQTPEQLTEVKEFRENTIEMIRPIIQFTDDGRDIPSYGGGRVLQSDIFAQHEPAYQPLSEDWAKENSPEIRRSDSDINQKSGERYQSFPEGSMSLLFSKEQQSLINTPNSAKHMGLLTPSSKLPAFFPSKDSIRLAESVSSIQKSISKFKVPEPSPSSSTLKEGIDKLKHRLSKYSSMPSPFNTLLAGSSKGSQHRHMDTPIAHLEEHLYTADVKCEDEKLTNIDGDEIAAPKNIGKFGQNEVILGLPKDRESPSHMSPNFLSKDKKQMTAVASPSQSTSLGGKLVQNFLMSEAPTDGTSVTSGTDSTLQEMILDQRREVTAVASPSQFTRSGGKLVQNFSMSENPTEGTSVTSGTDSPLQEIILDYKRDKKVAGVSNKLVSSPVKRFGQDLSVSMEHQGSVACELKQMDQLNKLVSGSGQDGNSIEHDTGDSCSTLVANKLDSLLSEMRAVSDSPFSRTNHAKVLAQLERVLDNNIAHLRNESELFTKSPLRDRNRDAMNLQFESADKNHQAGADPHLLKSYFHRRKNELSLEKSPLKEELAQSLTLRESTDSSCRKKLISSPMSKDSIPKRPRQDPSSPSHNYMMPSFAGKVILSPRSSSSRDDNNNQDAVHISQSPFPAQDVDIDSGRKRRNIQITSGDHIEKLARIQRSPKGDKSGGRNLEVMLEHANEVNHEGEEIQGDRTWMHWPDILVKFNDYTNHLASGSIDNLDSRVIYMLEDFAVHLLKVKKYEMLCSEIWSQRKVDHFSSVRNKRVAETRMLLYEIAYKKAKLQLMGVKRDIFLKRVQRLSSGIQECQMLKLKIEHLSECGARDAQIDSSLHLTNLVNSEGIHEACCDEVTKKRQALEALDRKIESLSKCFHSSSTTKGEQNCANTLALVQDQLKNRMCCRFIRQDLQVWEVDDFESRNGHYDILLNYQGYVNQRFSVKTGQLSSIIMSNKLNDINILKNLPNMGASIAFAFVFNAEITKKYAGSRYLAQETQISTSLICNLLDVIEEVQMTQLETRNLVQTSFHSPSVNQLDLQLCFIEFYSGQKVTLTLDMTCLNRGVYPSEILPSKIQAVNAGPEKSWPQSLIPEIRAAAENLRAGYSRIMRLCMSVSQVVQASSR